MNKSKSLRLAGTLLLSVFSLVSCKKPKVSSPINSLTPSVSDTATGNSVSNSPSTPDSSSSSGTSQEAPNDLVKVTINNGASSANVEGETVNALHVYSYDIDESGDDFLSGTEIPKGTEVKLFVYNYASAVELNLSNGDEKITRQYPAITPYVDDDKVEHITFIAKGDIVAETKAIDKLTTQTKAVKIKGLKRNNKDVSFSYMNRKGSGEAAEMKELLFTSYLNDGYDLLVSLANAGSKVYDITAAINGKVYDLPEAMSSLEANGNGGLFFPADVLKGDVVLTFSERKAIYHISVKGLDEGVTALFASMAKEDAKPTVISDGKITAGNILRCMFINTTENEYDVEVLVGGTKRTLSEKEAIVTKDGGGFTIPSAELIADVTVTLKKRSVDSGENKQIYTVTITNGKDNIRLLDGSTLLKDGDAIEAGVHSFYIYKDEDLADYSMANFFFKIGDKIITESTDIPAKGLSDDFKDIDVDGNIVVDVTLI